MTTDALFINQPNRSTLVGFGCGGSWGQTWFPEQQAHNLVSVAISAGAHWLDTGPTYSAGNAEARLGRFLSSTGETVAISTKVGTHRAANRRIFKDYSLEAMGDSLVRSLEHLGRSYVDLVLAHGPVDPAVEVSEVLESLTTLRESGLARAIGFSCDSSVAATVATKDGVDVLMTTINPDEGANLDSAAQASARGTLVVAKSPVGGGTAAFPKRPLLRPEALWANARTLRNQKLRAFTSRSRKLGPAGSLEFTSRIPSVGGVVIGSTNPVHVRANIAIVRGTSSGDATCR